MSTPSFERLVMISLMASMLCLIGIAWWRQYRPARQYRDEVVKGIIDHDRFPHQDLYHLLPGERCAPGYLRIPHAFGRGIESWDGCWDGNHSPSFTIDFLLKGEDAAVGAVVGGR